MGFNGSNYHWLGGFNGSPIGGVGLDRFYGVMGWV
jgi:hypothetical protein